MSQSEAELTLLINAKNLAAGVVGNFGKSLDGVGKAAGTMATKVGAGFKSVSSGVVNGLGNLTETLAQGGGLGPAAFAFGAYMAGQAAEALLENLIEKLAESTLVQVLGSTLAAAGSALGTILSTAISVGMAAFPVILVAVIVGAIVYLINNPDVANKILDFAKGVLDFIAKGLATLGRLLLDLFGKAWQLVIGAVGLYVQTVADFWLNLPGRLVGFAGAILGVFTGAFSHVLGFVKGIVKTIVGVIGGIVDSVKNALYWLGLLNAPEKNIGTRPPKSPGSIGGGGARAPSGIGGGGAAGHSHDVYMDGRLVAQLVDQRFGDMLRNAAPTTGRV